MNYPVYLYIAVMAIVTYLIRVLPLTLIKQEIKNPFIRSFLYYVPYVTPVSYTHLAYFLHNFPADTFLKSFSYLHITCNKGIAAISSSCIPGHKKFISLSDSYDHGRADLGILCMPTGRTHHGPFCCSRLHFPAAATTEAPALSPAVDLASCNTGKSLIRCV